MKNIRKRTVPALLALCLGSVFAGCGGSGKQEDGEKKLKVVTTIFPEYDWTMAVLGDQAENVSLTVIESGGVDSHSFQPSVEDVMEIAECDLFIYVGGISDVWVPDVLKNKENPDMRTICLMDVLGDEAKDEELVEGMQEEAEEEEEDEKDEHVWLSLRNASTFSAEIARVLSEMDPEHRGSYEKSLTAYQEKLAALDEEYRKTVEEAPFDTLLFGDRFPFRYLTEDYGLTYYAAFAGCSAETEASFETIAFLAEKLDELSLPAVLVIEGSDEKIARTVIENAGEKDQKILTLNSMQAVTEKEIREGASYLNIMEDNLEVLRSALQGGES